MKTLYLMEMGMNDDMIATDMQNHRVRVLENIDIIYKGKKYNMFFEFLQSNHFNYRTTNKRTGAPLKKPVCETVQKDALSIDTQFERLEGTWKDGSPFYASYRKGDLEREVYEKHYKITRENILKVINTYSIEKYNKVVLCEEEARNIINHIGGFREKDMIKKRDFRTDGDYFITKGKTWDNDHKIMVVKRREWEKTDDGRKLVITNSCEVDLVTRKITG